MGQLGFAEVKKTLSLGTAPLKPSLFLWQYLLPSRELSSCYKQFLDT